MVRRIDPQLGPKQPHTDVEWNRIHRGHRNLEQVAVSNQPQQLPKRLLARQVGTMDGTTAPRMQA